MSDSKKIRVVLADDHDLVRTGLKRVIESTGEITVVAQATDGLEACKLVQSEKPDVVVLDISMPNSDGIESAAEITSRDGDAKILILTGYGSEQHAVRALRAGATGFLSKTAPAEDLVDAIKVVARGERYLPEDLRTSVTRKLEQRRRRDLVIDSLSKREFEVLCYLAQGKTNREIAEGIGVSVKTIDTHRGHLLKKLELRNNADLTRFAIRHGYVQP